LDSFHHRSYRAIATLPQERVGCREGRTYLALQVLPQQCPRAIARQGLSHCAAGGLFFRQKGGFYHDGRFAPLADVVNHYVVCKGLRLNENEKPDLVQYLLSL
jgi:hypothetical protein